MIVPLALSVSATVIGFVVLDVILLRRLTYHWRVVAATCMSVLSSLTASILLQERLAAEVVFGAPALTAVALVPFWMHRIAATVVPEDLALSQTRKLLRAGWWLAAAAVGAALGCMLLSEEESRIYGVVGFGLIAFATLVFMLFAWSGMQAVRYRLR